MGMLIDIIIISNILVSINLMSSIVTIPPDAQVEDAVKVEDGGKEVVKRSKRQSQWTLLDPRTGRPVGWAVIIIIVLIVMIIRVNRSS